MSRGCARITKPPYTPPRGTCLFVNLLIRLRVTDNKCMSSSDKCEYSKVDTSTTHIFLASSVQCIALSHLKSWRILRRCIQTLGMILPPSINKRTFGHALSQTLLTLINFVEKSNNIYDTKLISLDLS